MAGDALIAAMMKVVGLNVMARYGTTIGKNCGEEEEEIVFCRHCYFRRFETVEGGLEAKPPLKLSSFFYKLFSW